MIRYWQNNQSFVSIPLAIASTAYAAGAAPGARTIDHYDLDDGDATHPIFIDYVFPDPNVTLNKATLSFHMRAFRSTANLNPSSIGTDSTAESGHSHSHSHSVNMNLDSSGYAQNVTTDTAGRIGSLGSPLQISSSYFPVSSNAQGSSGHTHSHSHSLTGSGAQSVTDGPTTTITAIAFDGVDKTAAIGGPWPNGDVVNLDITGVLPQAVGSWHTITLSLAGLGRVTSLLRFYYGY